MKSFLTKQNTLFSKNRKKFMQHMESGTIAVFHSNDLYPISADQTFKFVQHSDLLYLTGVDQEETVLILCPDATEKEYREILFIRKTNEKIAIWEGEKISQEKAIETTGIKTVLWTDEFERVFFMLMSQMEGIYINTNEHLRSSSITETGIDRFNKSVKSKYPAHKVHKSAPILHTIRSKKEPEEIALLQKACDITEKGFRRIVNNLHLLKNEAHIEAEFIHEFLYQGSMGFAYEPIIAGGRNSCILHYLHNNQALNKGDLILLDVGAEYKGYKSDMTRTIPVDGVFSPRQKTIYNSVLKVKDYANSILKPGVLLKDYHREVGLFMQEVLLEIGLLKKEDVANQDEKNPAYKRYFIHNTSHFIGADVHDYGIWHKPIEEDMVFTIEPGIYILEENIGIRLEDNVVVKKTENINLMKNIPITIDELENLSKNARK